MAGRGKIVEATLRGYARPFLGVALILTSRMYILYKYEHTSYLSNVMRNR